MRYLMIKAAAEVTKAELKSELQKHEDRETPAQEAAESKEEQELEERAGLHEKSAFMSGFGKRAAEDESKGRRSFRKALNTASGAFSGATLGWAATWPAAMGGSRVAEKAIIPAMGLGATLGAYLGYKYNDKGEKVAGVKDFLKKLFTVHHDISASKALPIAHTHGVDEKVLQKLNPKELLMAGAALGGGVGFGHEFGKRIGKGRKRKEHGPSVTPMPGGVVIRE